MKRLTIRQIETQLEEVIEMIQLAGRSADTEWYDLLLEEKDRLQAVYNRVGA